MNIREQTEAETHQRYQGESCEEILRRIEHFTKTLLNLSLTQLQTYQAIGQLSNLSAKRRALIRDVSNRSIVCSP